MWWWLVVNPKPKKTDHNFQLKLDLCYDLANKSSVWIY